MLFKKRNNCKYMITKKKDLLTLGPKYFVNNCNKIVKMIIMMMMNRDLYEINYQLTAINRFHFNFKYNNVRKITLNYFLLLCY